MYVIIVGCGRVGGGLAKVVAAEGHNVVVIDTKESRFRDMDPDFPGVQLLGDGTDVDVLRDAKIDSADVLVAATGDDNANLLSAQIARKLFNVPRAFVRMKDPKKMDVYESYDVEAVSATSLAVKALAEMLKGSPGIAVHATLGEGAPDQRVKVVSFRLENWKSCERLGKLVRGGHVSVAAVIKDGVAVLGYAEDALEPGCVVVGAVKPAAMRHVSGLFPRGRTDVDRGV